MLQQLYPAVGECRPLQGLYLALKLHEQAREGDVFIYANYIASLDGRIALFNALTHEFEVPKNIANGRDWRLYQELAGQADVMLTSARYFRQLALGKAQDLLPVGSGEAYADIKSWREKQGLKPQPDVVILSNSLDIPLAALNMVKDRKVMVFTASIDVAKIESLEQAGVTVLQAEEITGLFVRLSLIKLHYRSAYLIAGPQVHATMLQDACINALFLTTYFTLLGGKNVSGLLDTNLRQAQPLKLISSYLDTKDNQMFQQFTYV